MSSSSSLSLSSCSFSSHGTDGEIVRAVGLMQEVVVRHFATKKKRKSKKKKRKTYVHRQGIHQSVGRISKSVKVASTSLESGYSSTASSATVHRSRKPVAEQLGQTAKAARAKASKGKGKESEESAHEDAISWMETANANLATIASAKAAEAEAMRETAQVKQLQLDMKIVHKDMSRMTDLQREIHMKMLEEVKNRRGW